MVTRSLGEVLPVNFQVAIAVHFKRTGIETRLTYNCAHLRSTKETLTIEYCRLIFKKIWVKIFGTKFFWVKILG